MFYAMLEEERLRWVNVIRGEKLVRGTAIDTLQVTYENVFLFLLVYQFCCNNAVKDFRLQTPLSGLKHSNARSPICHLPQFSLCTQSPRLGNL